ncbi:phosphoribosyltransferase [Desulfuromonas carbonis]|uniref:phosphoribosyltransferase n=1 Tax=Desulfuromonas sp. DDH964 TaxID=1823759 RepID=UPI00078E10E1|nr:phosphoribosyltransferase family protein [Desulfuromonas sp. DDH964]AMV71703.1 Putative phosphoribosyl transferase [Desulfuromonas sp. DDH964]
MKLPGNLRDLPELRQRTGVFTDRRQAGERLGELLAAQGLVEPLLLAIPAGGVPVAAAIAGRQGWPLRAAVVSKVLLPWDSEAGYGAVAWDGEVLLNQELLPRLGLAEAEIAAGVAATREKVARRLRELGGAREWPELAGRAAVLVDDGLASGFTLLAAVAALRRAGAGQLVVAVPTAHFDAVQRVAQEVDLLCCANLRGGFFFAVAAAYRAWSDVSEAEAQRLLLGAIP